MEDWAEDFRLALVGGREPVSQGRRHTHFSMIGLVWAQGALRKQEVIAA